MRAQDKVLGCESNVPESRRDGISSKCRASGTRFVGLYSQHFVLGCHIWALRACGGAAWIDDDCAMLGVIRTTRDFSEEDCFIGCYIRGCTPSFLHSAFLVTSPFGQ